MRRSSRSSPAERLLTLAADSVEISHEVLLTAWPLLRDTWLADTHADRIVRSRLHNAAAESERNSRDPSYLYSGSLLEAATETAARIDADPARNPPLSQVERDFLAASQRAAGPGRRFRQAFNALVSGWPRRGSQADADEHARRLSRRRSARATRSSSKKRSSGVPVGDNSVQNNNHYYYGPGTWSARPPRPRGNGMPYRGLSMFEEADQEFFFGRDLAVAAVMDRMSGYDLRHRRRLRRIRHREVVAAACRDAPAPAPGWPFQ